MEIVFYTNGNMLVSILSHLWNEVMELVNKDMESGFNLEIDNNLSINEIRYEALLSGLDELEYIIR